jgi:hypothetical protein
MTTDYDSVDYFTDPSLVPDPHPYYDHIRAKDPVWAMANRDPSVFDKPNELVLDRKGNRHFSFGIGVHRCVGSNVARTVFKSMITAVLDRMPDYMCDPEGTEHYETIGVIQGMKHLPATFTPSKPLGPGLDETLEKLQRICNEQELARPITERKEAAVID